MEPIEQVNQDFEVKKPKKKGLLIGGIIAAVVVVSLALIYFLVLTNPKFIFSKAIDKIFTVDTTTYDSIKLDTKMKAAVELKDTDMQEQLSELEKFTLEAGVQLDIEEKQEIVELGVEYDNQAVIDAQLCYNDGEMYAYLDELFDKYIEIDMDEEAKAEMDEMFEMATSEEVEKAGQILTIIKDEFKAQVKEKGEFEKEKVTIDVGEEEQKVTKTTLSLSEKKLCKIASDMFSNLADNKEFLDYFEEEKLEDELKEVAKSIKNNETNGKSKVEISLYTKGLLNNKLVAVDMEVYVESEETTIVFSIVKEDEDVYSYSLSGKMTGAKVELVKGKIKIEKDEDNKEEQSGKAIITAEIFQVGNAKLDIEYSAEYNNGIDKIDTSNNVNMNNLTESDIQSIMTKLMERPVIGDIIKQQNSLFEQAQDAADGTKKAQIYEAISSVKIELLAGVYSNEFTTEQITEQQVKEMIEEYLDESYNIQVSRLKSYPRFIITVEGMELDGVSNVIDLSNI